MSAGLKRKLPDETIHSKKPKLDATTSKIFENIELQHEYESIIVALKDHFKSKYECLYPLIAIYATGEGCHYQDCKAVISHSEWYDSEDDSDDESYEYECNFGCKPSSNGEYVCKDCKYKEYDLCVECGNIFCGSHLTKCDNSRCDERVCDECNPENNDIRLYEHFKFCDGCELSKCPESMEFYCPECDGQCCDACVAKERHTDAR